MQKYVYKIDKFSKLFEKLKYGAEKYGAIYSAMLFKLEDKERLAEFENFLLKYIRISDSLFYFSDKKILLILEDTTIKGAIKLSENLRKKIKEKGFTYKYLCSAIQGDYIETEKKLYKSLNKRIKKAKEEKNTDCVTEL